MKKFYGICLSFVCILIFLACSEDGSGLGLVGNSPSYRDRVYTGKNLTVYLNGAEMKSVTSADVQSEQRIFDEDEIPRDEEGNPILGAEYDTEITLAGFPASGSTTTLQTVLLNLLNFSGEVTVAGKRYAFKGEFTGAPLDPPEDQGCLIWFTTE